MIWFLQSLRSIEAEFSFNYMANSTSVQYKLIPAPRLGTRVGNCAILPAREMSKQIELFMPHKTQTMFGRDSDYPYSITFINIKLYVSIFNILKHNFSTHVDVDECAEGPDSCPVHSSSSCVNLMGSYHCNCLTGWRNEDSPTCADINECSAGSYSCPLNSTCVNTQGSYRCQCNRCFYMSDNACHRK